MSGLISYDELVTAPVLITAIRKVPADDDRDLSAPVGRGSNHIHCETLDSREKLCITEY